MKRKAQMHRLSHANTQTMRASIQTLCTPSVKSLKRIMSVLLVLAMLVTTAPQSLLSDTVISADAATAAASAQTADTAAASAQTAQTVDTAQAGLAEETSMTLQNPRIVEDSSMTSSGQKVTWDCVWFGSYPQIEIVDKAETSGCCGMKWASDSDYEVDVSLYEKLKGATYDSNGDTEIGGTKYRRIKKSDATCAITSDDRYNWSDDSTYHYFRYDPIKWRVLNISDGKALLLADKALDDLEYNTERNDVTWEKSTIRSWLNGYDSSSNACGTDYTSKNFIDSAFTSDEQNVIETTLHEDSYYSVTVFGKVIGRGEDTEDEIFLLSPPEVCPSDEAKSYGFVSIRNAYDEARRCKSSAFAKAKGALCNTDFYTTSFDGNCRWWLRGLIATQTACVLEWGSASTVGGSPDGVYTACRPALNLNLLSSDKFSYAGTVKSDGTVSEVAAQKQENAAKTYTITLPKTAANGLISASADNAKKGDIVTLTAKADDGYKLGSLTVKTADGKSVDATAVEEGSKYSFVMPASDVVVEATFEEAEKDPANSSNPFADVTEDAYFYDAVQWAYNNKIATGTDATHFSPNGITNRAQALTFLWRTAGEKKVNYKLPFNDVTADSYYEKAVRWACSKNITKGMTDETFGPLSEVSRAQMVTFLWRMAGSPKVNSKAAGGKNLSFSDVSSDSYYYDAVNWAVSRGITAGMSATTFAPDSKCTRAQVVTFIYRYKNEK